MLKIDNGTRLLNEIATSNANYQTIELNMPTNNPNCIAEMSAHADTRSKLFLKHGKLFFQLLNLTPA